MQTRTTYGLRCACCGGVLAAATAAPAPPDVPPTLRYHADLRACLRAVLAAPQPLDTVPAPTTASSGAPMHTEVQP